MQGKTKRHNQKLRDPTDKKLGHMDCYSMLWPMLAKVATQGAAC